MSIQTVEISLPESIIKVIEIRQGPAGSGGGTNSVTSATTSDGTADLDLLNVDTVTATVTGTLTADHIHGNLAGNVYGHIRAGETLAKGDPVYVSGSHGSGSTLIPIVSKADASNAAKMPAIGIMDAAVANNANGHMVIVGTITELNTAGYTVNAELYVASGGGMTATPPTARAQPVARVERVNANNGAVIVKVNGLSASDATANTLVRRTANGDASFGILNTSGLTVTGGTTFGEESLVQFDALEYYYGTGAASAHRIALGGVDDSSTGTALFGAATAAAANQILGMVSATAKGTTAAGAATVDVITINIPSAGFWKIEVLAVFLNASGSSTLFSLLFDNQVVIPASPTPFRIGLSYVNTGLTQLAIGSPTALVANIGTAQTVAAQLAQSVSYGLIETTAASTLVLRVSNQQSVGTVTVIQASLSATKL